MVCSTAGAEMLLVAIRPPSVHLLCASNGRDIEDSCGEEQCTKLRCYRYESIKLMLAGPRAATTTTITVTTLTS